MAVTEIKFRLFSVHFQLSDFKQKLLPMQSNVSQGLFVSGYVSKQSSVCKPLYMYINYSDFDDENKAV